MDRGISKDLMKGVAIGVGLALAAELVGWLRTKSEK